MIQGKRHPNGTSAAHHPWRAVGFDRNRPVVKRRGVLVGLTSDEPVENPLPVGQESKGPIGLVCHTGTSWHLPNCAVEYPFSFSISASGAAVLGRIELYPGADVATSGIPPMPAA